MIDISINFAIGIVIGATITLMAITLLWFFHSSITFKMRQEIREHEWKFHKADLKKEFDEYYMTEGMKKGGK